MKYRAEDIRAEYDEAADSPDEFEKVKWGSQEKMLNRFRLAMAKLDFSNAKRWLDVGCGTGAFQTLVLKAHPTVEAVGIDISPKLLDFARTRPLAGAASFIQCDFMFFEDAPFDIITCVGVLQKTTFTPEEFFRRAVHLLRDGGALFVDTKNIGWKRFAEPDFFPEREHEWFSVEELSAAARAAGFVIVELNGFLPGEGLVTAPEESHTVFIVARKGAGA